MKKSAIENVLESIYIHIGMLATDNEEFKAIRIALIKGKIDALHDLGIISEKELAAIEEEIEKK